ncbi:MAG: class I SAM-dependent methyltransferase [Chlamydiae bacterium]|nr:class I SAM-dependent methyltransferase [Chlamydiota bacterium]MBI3276600.1 class I SAM-dependent methyltransferase [Chlamydiota bacterium]
MSKNWPVLLFKKSVLKQNKFKALTAYLGKTEGLTCLDIGSDNGVISLLLRQRGGYWKSADLDEKTVECIRSLVKDDVFQIDGRHTPFKDNEFDRVLIVDFLEHIHTDQEFIDELYRIMKSGGELIINVPHVKNSFLRKFRLFMGQTDEKHGHVRPGYTVQNLQNLLGKNFTWIEHRTYSKFFSEFVDTLMTWTMGILKKGENASQKGMVIEAKDFSKNKKMFRIYTLIYPFLWFLGKCDGLLFRSSGYMLIARAKINKEEVSRNEKSI